jgi:hypothetical protein
MKYLSYLGHFFPKLFILETSIFRFLWAIETEKRNIYRVIISDTVLFCFAASAATADTELTKKSYCPHLLATNTRTFLSLLTRDNKTKEAREQCGKKWFGRKTKMFQKISQHYRLATQEQCFFKEVARGGERTQVLSISFIFSFSSLYH